MIPYFQRRFEPLSSQQQLQQQQHHCTRDMPQNMPIHKNHHEKLGSLISCGGGIKTTSEALSLKNHNSTLKLPPISVQKKIQGYLLENSMSTIHLSQGKKDIDVR
jgi:hypothetical protein